MRVGIDPQTKGLGRTPERREKCSQRVTGLGNMPEPRGRNPADSSPNLMQLYDLIGDHHKDQG